MSGSWRCPRITGTLLVVLPALALAAVPVQGQSPGEPVPATLADSTAIRQAALDYIEGWYEGDEERMKRALHPRLEKRILGSELGAPIPLVEMTAMELVDATRRGGGADAPGPRRADVNILDIFGRAASVRVDADGWVDYLHLVQTEEGWKIVNVLWELRPPATEAGPTGQ
ncbi:MAG: nuclear transport factor 2 family protein [Gemmatimonadota bacterium]